MRYPSGLARIALLGLALAVGALVGGLLIPGEVGALLRGYGAMLVPAVAWLYAGLGLRSMLARRSGAVQRTPLVISARDGSFRT
jgi:hypothetical protein